MACEITSGRGSYDCKLSVGGLKTMYVLKGFDKTLKADSTITNSVMTATTASNDVYEFPLHNDGNTYSENNTTSREAGTSIFSQEGAIVLKRQDSLTQDLLESLSKGRFQIILEDHNGQFRLIGLENGADFTVNSVTGGAMEDRSGYDVSFVAKEKSMAIYVAEALIGAGDAFDVQTDLIDPNA